MRIASSNRLRCYWDRLATGPWFWCLILWAAWALRLWQLDASDLTFDEAATYFVAHRPLLDILAYLRGAVREHPPVYYLLMRLWMSLTGTSEYGLRLFAAGASLLGIALTVRLARTLTRRLNSADAFGKTISSLLPALTLALLPLEVYYARDARMYTLIIVWAAWSSLRFLPLLFDREWPRLSTLLGLLLVNALGLFTHYYMALLIVTQFASLLLARRWRSLLAWSAAHGLVGLVGLIWLVRSPGLSASLTEAWGRFVPVWPSGSQLRRLLADLLFGPIEGVPWVMVYGWGLLVALGLFVAWRRSRVIGTWLTVSALLPVALAFLMPEPPRPRYLIFVLPFVALALGQLPRMMTKYRRSAVIWLGLSALIVSVLGVYGLPRTLRWVKSSYGRTVATVSAHARPGDGVLFYGPWQSLMFHYYEPDGFPPITLLPRYAPPQLVPEEAEPVLQELLSNYQRLWVIPAAVNDVDPTRFAANWLNTHAHPVWSRQDLSLYLPPLPVLSVGSPEQYAPSSPVEIAFGDHLRLQHLTSGARRVPAGEDLRLTMTWAVDGPLDGEVKLVLSLVDEYGYRWREWDVLTEDWLDSPSSWGADGLITDRQGLIVPQGAPPGTFTLQLAVVDMTSGAPLQPVGTTGPHPQPSVDLLTFDVSEPVTPPVLVDVDEFVGPFTFESPEGTTDVLTLAAYGLTGLRFQQGYPMTVRLHWLATQELPPDLELCLQLRHQSRLALSGTGATPIVEEKLPLIPGYPATKWSSGRLVSLPVVIQIPADAAPGRADLILTVCGPDGETWAVEGNQHLTLGTLTIEERAMLRQLPSGLKSVQVDFGGQIGLRGYRIEGEARPGGQLELNYAWYALRSLDKQYSVFNHLLTLEGQPITHVDGWPQDGVVLTKQWRPGEYIPDSHTLEIPAGAPPGPYLLAVGLYDAVSEERLQAVYEGQPLPNDQWLHVLDGAQ